MRVLADGSSIGDFVVSGGQITLPRNAKDVRIGLQVIPRVKLLIPEVGTQTGTAQASQMHAHKYSVLFHKTAGAYINGKAVSFRTLGANVLDKPPAPYSGWKQVGEYGWGTGTMECEIAQPDPLPFHILAVVRHWTTNE